MEQGTIEREIYVDASPEVAFEVVSSPDHIREWWPDDVDLDPVPGGAGELVFGDRATGAVVPMQVVDVEPPHLFSFRWGQPAGESPTPANSLLVTFELVPCGAGTTVRMKESGWRELGWEAAVLEQAFRDHVEGWSLFIPRLGDYVARLVATS